VLARRKSGGGCVYQDLGNSVFSFLNPVSDFGKEDYKTMNNAVLIDSLKKIGIPNAEPTGRNDICVDGKKVSGSAYKLSLGKRDGSGRKTLHHGTMLIDLDLTALERYLSPNKAKLLSKGVDSVVSRVLNLKERVPDLSHEMYSQALAGAFRQKWPSQKANEQLLRVSDLEKIDQLREIYEGYKRWEWRFGETPSFTNSFEKKFDWALLDIELTVEKGLIKSGRCYTDCLVPTFIDELNEVLQSGQVSYDEAGMQGLGDKLSSRFQDNEAIISKYIPELVTWMKSAI
jgi:lipoate---protein ligase